MTKNELIALAVAGFTAVLIALIIAGTSIVKYERDAEINAQTEVQKTEIVEAEKTQRAKEHLEWFPWN